jgi:large subunit ribosomal protein L30
MATKPAQKKLKITLIRSVINTRESHRATVRGLGLRRLNHTVEIEDTARYSGYGEQGRLPLEVRGINASEHH